MIALVDYGAGNLASVRKALAALGAEVGTPRTPGDLAGARGIIVPGVGHFAATAALTGDWCRAIRGAVDRRAALLGICLGMQWLFEGSTESLGLRGLGYFAGTCELLIDESPKILPAGSAEGLAKPARDPAPPKGRFKIPHVGWNSLDMPTSSAVLAGVPDHAQVYFTHSYVAPVTPDTAAVTTYGSPFAAAVERGRVAGVQFHPEKSGDVGLRILKNWLELAT